jgi:hypothetical protein
MNRGAEISPSASDLREQLVNIVIVEAINLSTVSN